MSQPGHLLLIRCPDRVGIVAAVAGFMSERGCNILEAVQFTDPANGTFFMRQVVTAGPGYDDISRLRSEFAAIGSRFAMDWRLVPPGGRHRVLILVSKYDHCLNDLLYRHRAGDLSMTVTAVVSNHPDFRHIVESHGVPFYHRPVTAETRDQQEGQILELFEETRSDTVVLARYMQILTPRLVDPLAGRCINIHHSFLPGFKGARPYHQAYDRGVKLIGATAHYVTRDLDEGPIIDQEVLRVDHSLGPEQLARAGRDIERLVLARALQAHVEDRVMLNGKRTVVLR